MKKSIKFSLASVGGMLLTGTAVADITLYDITRNGSEAWEAALAENGKLVKSIYDLTAQFGDPGIKGLHGPVVLGDGNKTADSNLNPFGKGGQRGRGEGSEGFVIVGASAGYGNKETTLLTNWAIDSFDIIMNDDSNTAIKFNATSLLGSNTVDITVYGTGGGLLGSFVGVAAPAAGNTYGINSDDAIGYINIYDANTGGYEGITGTGTFYRVPSPGTLLFLGAACLIGYSRRRR